MFGVSMQAPPPLTDEGDADKLSCCLELKELAVEFLHYA